MGIQIDNDYLFHLLFADVQVIIANDAEDASYMFRELLEKCKKWWLKINPKKTEYISIQEESEDIHTDKV